MIRSARYKLVVGSGRRKRQDHLETGRPLSGPYLKLYDLERDPGETINLATFPTWSPSAPSCSRSCTIASSRHGRGQGRFPRNSPKSKPSTGACGRGSSRGWPTRGHV